MLQNTRDLIFDAWLRNKRLVLHCGHFDFRDHICSAGKIHVTVLNCLKGCADACGKVEYNCTGFYGVVVYHITVCHLQATLN